MGRNWEEEIREVEEEIRRGREGGSRRGVEVERGKELEKRE